MHRIYSVTLPEAPNAEQGLWTQSLSVNAKQEEVTPVEGEIRVPAGAGVSFRVRLGDAPWSDPINFVAIADDPRILTVPGGPTLKYLRDD